MAVDTNPQTYIDCLDRDQIPAWSGFWGERFIGVCIGLMLDRISEVAIIAVKSQWLYQFDYEPFEQPLDALDLMGADCNRPHYTGETYLTSTRPRIRAKWDFWTGDPQAGMLEEYVAAGIPGITITVPRDWIERPIELLDACIDTANEIKAKYNLHISLTYHSIAGTPIATADANNIASLLTLCASLRTNWNIHISNNSGIILYHSSPDTVNGTLFANPVDLSSAAQFLDDLWGKFNKHIKRADIHTNPDLVNAVISHPDVYWSRFFLNIPEGSHPLTDKAVEWGDPTPKWGDGTTVWGPVGGTPEFYGLMDRISSVYKPAQWVPYDYIFELPASGGFVRTQAKYRFDDEYYVPFEP